MARRIDMSLGIFAPSATWRNFRAKEWQRDLATAAAPITRSGGTSSPGVPEIELREDREIIVKVGMNREHIRGLTLKDLVQRAERQRSGYVAMIANSVAGAEVLRKHAAWLRAFGPGSVVQEPSWGVVAYHIPVRSMKLTLETMVDVAAELLRQNNWGEDSKIQYLGWLTRPGERAEGSILIEFTSPVVANRAIVSGVAWGKQIHNASRFCREGRMKLCKKSQKPGHIQSHCSNVFKCGHCANGHPTWECPSTKGQAIPDKCANCGEGHRPTIRECPVKVVAMNEDKQALANCPAYHRVPMHFRVAASTDKEATSARPDSMRPWPPKGFKNEAKESQTNSDTAGMPRVNKTPSGLEKALHRRAGRYHGRATKPTPPDLPHPDTQQDSLERQLTQFINEVTTVNEAGHTSEPYDEEELDPESPEYRKLKIEGGLQTGGLYQADSQRIEAKCQELMGAIQTAIEDSTPWVKPSAWSNPDFDDACKVAVKEVRRLRRRTRTKYPYDWMCYSEARNRKTRLVKKTLSRAHQRRVQQVIEDGPQDMWRLAKWARNREGAYEKGITPSLEYRIPKCLELSRKQWSKKQRHSGLPSSPNPRQPIYPTQTHSSTHSTPAVTAQEIQEAVRGAKAGKAPGRDGIPNSLWHKLIEIPVVLETVVQLFNACINTGYNPSHFRRSITVVLRKQGKSDYQLAKSFRPVALLSTLGKFLEAVVARRMSYAAETNGLLPRTHLGGRKGISTDHAIHIIIDRIKTAWGKGKPVVSLLMLDVSGAYDNVSNERLLHNLKKRRLGHFVPWVRAFLSNRSTSIRMPEGMSDQIPTPTGIPQGSPISPILYLIYNTDLIENCGNGVTSNGWVDDVCFMTKGDSERETIKRLRATCRKADQWAEKHASVFDPKKYALVHFLGYWLNPGLEFRHHREKAVANAGVSLHAIRSLAGSTWEASLYAMRKIYQAVIIPQMLFGVSAWYQPMLISNSKARTISQPFAAIQKQAACLISGAFKTTAAEALNAELYLPPISVHMNRLVKETALRLRTGPEFAMPPTMLRRRPADERYWAVWTPMEAQAWKTDGCLTAPPGTFARNWESRKAFVLAPRQAPEVIIEDR
ncbi:hypothetical protein DTO027I6_9813 [Penicillium roqueforti]|nr:hypothetical protein CBS147337_9894 [Penicillium roqueforti]KAI3185297.1 hypothetical protein DTO027I6_9813 [Penicillium roqueforti]